MTRVAVLGASGYVGRAVSNALLRRGAQVTEVPAPRLLETSFPDAVEQIVEACRACAVIVNCAGLSDATDADERSLMAANAELAGAAASAARVLRARLVHVSSAAVQGRAVVLDASRATAAFSPYSRSKAAGEDAVLTNCTDAVVYRPPGVHDPSRTVTRAIARVAASPLASVSDDGTGPTAQALLPNVADAIAFLALSEAPPPRIVHHPSEGLTTAGLLRELGGREPRHLPRMLTRGLVRLAYGAGRCVPPAAGQARRVDMLWHGQEQAPSWLDVAGWQPPVGRDGWTAMGRLLREQARTNPPTLGER